MDIKERKCDAKKLFELLAADGRECILKGNTLSADMGSFTFGYRFEGLDYSKETVSLCGVKKTDGEYEITVCNIGSDSERTLKADSVDAFCIFRDTRINSDFFKTSPLDNVLIVSSQLSFAAQVYGEEILTDSERELLKIGEFLSLNSISLYGMSAFSCMKCSEYTEGKNPELSEAFAELSMYENVRKGRKKKAVSKVRSLLSGFDKGPDVKAAYELCSNVCETYESVEVLDCKKLSELRCSADCVALEKGFDGVFPEYKSDSRYIIFKPYYAPYREDGKMHFYDIGVSFGDTAKGTLYKSAADMSDILPLNCFGGEETDIGTLIQGISDILNGKKPSHEFERLPCISHQKEYGKSVLPLFFGSLGVCLIALGVGFAVFEGSGTSFTPSYIVSTALGACLVAVSCFIAVGNGKHLGKAASKNGK